MQQFIACQNRRLVREQCPWATVFVRVPGGFWAFDKYDPTLPVEKQEESDHKKSGKPGR